MKLGDSFLSEEIKYSGGAHFRYETENGEFMDTLVAVGDSENKPRITCEKVGHDQDYGGGCHRCGWQSTWYEDIDKVTITKNPYFYIEDTLYPDGTLYYSTKHGREVHIGTNPLADNYGYIWNNGCWDCDHDNICNGCGGAMLLKAGVYSWNYCNLAIFGYGGMDWNDFVASDSVPTLGYFKQPNWPDWKK